MVHFFALPLVNGSLPERLVSQPWGADDDDDVIVIIVIIIVVILIVAIGWGVPCPGVLCHNPGGRVSCHNPGRRFPR